MAEIIAITVHDILAAGGYDSEITENTSSYERYPRTYVRSLLESKSSGFLGGILPIHHTFSI